MLNNLSKKNIYIKYLIGKIIESKLNKLYNNINDDKILLDFNYYNIKKEFKNILNHKGGNLDYYFDYYSPVIPSDSLYTRSILLPYNTVFTSDKIENKKILLKLIKILNIINKNYNFDNDNKAINIINEIIEIINTNDESNYNNEDINRFIDIINKLNSVECIKIKNIIKNNFRDVDEKIDNLCSKV
jgi:hypothetical protein